jgi:hypothetical protein
LSIHVDSSRSAHTFDARAGKVWTLASGTARGCQDAKAWQVSWPQ